MNKGCPKCGRTIDQNYKLCPYCNYDFKEIDTFFKNVKIEKYKEEEKYAGFIKRLVAGIIDIYIIVIITAPLFIKTNEQITKQNILILLLISFVVYILYNSLLERTKLKGSLGKQIIKIEVTDEYENPVTFYKAVTRNICKIFNILTLGIGFLICAYQPQKQTLGDKISKTYVINKTKFKEEKIIQVAPIYKRVIAFIIDVIYIGLLTTISCYTISYLAHIMKIPENLVKYEELLYKMIILIITILHFPYKESKRGKTKGKELLKIRITNMEEEKVSFPTAIFRYILIVLDIITLGFLLPLSDNKNQTLKDKITHTIIIED